MRYLAFLVLVLSSAPPTLGQDLGWRGEAELEAGLYFGAFGQSLISSRVSVAHADSAWEIGGEASQLWGKFQNSDGDWDLFYRSWKIETTADYRPLDTWSPFALAIVESSFQRRIDQRWNAGAGIKWAIVRSETARFDVSAALLAEHTDFNENVPIGPGDENLLARWSARVRARRRIGDGRWELKSTTLYRPEARDFDRYVVTTSNGAAYALSDAFSLTLSFDDTYDSRAKARGARSNHEGQLMLGIEATLF